jgi:predicted permease
MPAGSRAAYDFELRRSPAIRVFTYFLPVLNTLLQLFTLMAFGFLLTRFWGWSARFFHALSRFIVKIALPVYFFTRISVVEPETIREGTLFPLAALVIVCCSLVCSWLFFRLFPASSSEKRACVALSSFGNSGYIPLMLIEIFPLTLPMVAEVFGSEIPTLYVGTYLLVQSPLLWAVGNFLVTGRERKLRLREMLSPPLIGILCGLLMAFTGGGELLLHRQYPTYHIYRALERLGQTTFPLILLSLGSMIANINFAQGLRRGAARLALGVMAFRFLFLPLLFLAAYFLFLDRMHLLAPQIWVLFLETHLPPATALSIMTAQARKNEDLVSFSILITYLAFLLFLPLYLLVFLNLPNLF